MSREKVHAQTKGHDRAQGEVQDQEIGEDEKDGLRAIGHEAHSKRCQPLFQQVLDKLCPSRMGKEGRNWFLSGRKLFCGSASQPCFEVFVRYV